MVFMVDVCGKASKLIEYPKRCGELHGISASPIDLEDPKREWVIGEGKASEGSICRLGTVTPA